VAVNCWVVPLTILGLVGVSTIEARVAEVTVRVVDPDMLPDVAVIVVEPVSTEVVKPLEPDVLLMVATNSADEYHVTDVVISCVVLSENIPVAANHCVVPFPILGLVGVTARETRVAEVTVSVVEPEIPSDVAVIVVKPAATPVAVPLDPEISLIVATAAFDDIQFVDAVRSCVVLSENVPVAVNCRVVSMARLGLDGVTAIEISVAGVTVTCAVPDIFPHCAVISASPGCMAIVCPGLRLASAAPSTEKDDVVVPTPFPPDAISTVSTSDEVHMTDEVRSVVVLSE
jgi:hypothetical protein